MLAQFERPDGKEQYLTHAAHQKWLSKAKEIAQIGKSSPLPSTLPQDMRSALIRLIALVDSDEAGRTTRNKAYARAQREKHADIFETKLGYILNEQQCEAILHDEQRCLVVAGAGTGKTSTIVGKSLHILAEELARPDEVLLLAFTKKAAGEMQERIDHFGADGVEVRTFHSLGLRILAEATGRKPSLSRLTEDDRALKREVEGYLKEMIATAGVGATVVKFLAYYRYPYRDPASFATPHHYHQFIQGHGVRSLKGERLKSVEESVIANWLALHGIQYLYERDYPHDTASVEYRQYKPDFYLPEYDLYIEHFGVNREGQPPPFVTEPQRYTEGMVWKRNLHAQKKTQLIETYSYMAADGCLIDHLERSLLARGVTVREIPPEEVAPLLQEEGMFGQFVKLLLSFLSLFKGNAWTLQQVLERASASGECRAAEFLKVFEEILYRYERALAAEPAIDFNDMISKATEAVRNGSYRSGYRYILVDEFQDISRGRAFLLQALLDQVADARLFSVGDDWQSIYRFTGSDIDLMTSFDRHFGFTRRTDLVETHRFGSSLLEASSKFVMANPQQLKKSLVSDRQTQLPALEVISTPGDGASVGALQTALDSIAASDPREGKIEVLLQARYRFLLEERDAAGGNDTDVRGNSRPLSNAVRIDPRIELIPMTVHGAKGLEADYAIIAGVVGGRYGFPTEIADDPLLDLVLAQPGDYPNAEERRLFYVAMTRAKIKCFILTGDDDRSVFIDELEGDGFKSLVIASGAAARSVGCPTCRGGRFVRREGPYGTFWGCSNFPGCKRRATKCPRCGSVSLAPTGSIFKCVLPKCGYQTIACPKCRTGAVLERYGPYGVFWGCSEWRKEGASCLFKTKRRHW